MGGIGTAIGAVSSIGKNKEGKRMMREGQKGIDNFEWQELGNSYGALAPSMLGANLMKEEQARRDASMIDVIQSGGTRALGALGTVQENSNNVYGKIGANLDAQQKAIDYAAAGQDARNQEMMERRQANELAGYGALLNTGLNMKYQGLADLSNTFYAHEANDRANAATAFDAMGALGTI